MSHKFCPLSRAKEHFEKVVLGLCLDLFNSAKQQSFWDNCGAEKNLPESWQLRKLSKISQKVEPRDYLASVMRPNWSASCARLLEKSDKTTVKNRYKRMGKGS